MPPLYGGRPSSVRPLSQGRRAQHTGSRGPRHGSAHVCSGDGPVFRRRGRRRCPAAIGEPYLRAFLGFFVRLGLLRYRKTGPPTSQRKAIMDMAEEASVKQKSTARTAK